MNTLSTRVLGALAAIKREWLMATCRHEGHFYTKPELAFDENGAPMVTSESYCPDCGVSLPNPWAITDVEVLAMLQQGELMREANERNR